MLAKFSEELKDARQRSGLTLEQVAAKTRIDGKFLAAIEAGNFTFQPELYIKAFIKDYCKALGIDEVKMLKRYEMAKQGKLEPEAEPEPVEEEKPEVVIPVIKPSIDAVPDETARPKIKIVDPYSTLQNGQQKAQSPGVNKKVILFGLITVVLLVLALIVYVIFFLGGNDKFVAEKPYEQILEENKQRYSELEPKKQEENLTAVSADSLNLFIKAKDTTWVKISYDSLRSEEFMLYPYSKKLVKAKSNFRITLGNSAGVDFSLNDKLLQFQGRKGKRADVIIDASGLKVSEEKKNQSY